MSVGWSLCLALVAVALMVTVNGSSDGINAGVSASSSTSSSVVQKKKKDERCEEMTIPMCRGIGYNWTSMPNALHHETQEEAGLEVHQFWPLVEIQCSADMRFFLCSIYAPICIQDYPTSIPACKSVCLRAQSGCAPLMRKYGFAWPERMHCDNFPQYGDPRNLCMDAQNGTLPAPTDPPPPSPPPPLSADKRPVTPPTLFRPSNMPKSCRGGNKRLCAAEAAAAAAAAGGVAGSEANAGSGANSGVCRCQCRLPLVRLAANDVRYNRSLSVGDVENCLLPCSNPFFSPDEKWFASLWIALWAAIAALSSATTFATFLIDRQRFRFFFSLSLSLSLSLSPRSFSIYPTPSLSHSLSFSLSSPLSLFLNFASLFTFLHSLNYRLPNIILIVVYAIRLSQDQFNSSWNSNLNSNSFMDGKLLFCHDSFSFVTMRVLRFVLFQIEFPKPFETQVNLPCLCCFILKSFIISLLL